MIFVGIDWAEDHHDICIIDEHGEALDGLRIADGLEGISQLHARLADHVDEPQQLVIGLETDRGLLVDALVCAGYQLYAVNPLSVSRYRDRHRVSGAKSDRGDAKVLADLVRTDRHNHRPVAADTDLAHAVKVLARTHQNLIWTRQRQVNQLRSALREYYPAALKAFGTDLAHGDALGVLAKAPTPELGRRLSTAQLRSALKRGGRQRNIDRRAAEIRDALRADQLQAPMLVADAFGTTTAALVPIIAALNDQIAAVEHRLVERFEQHPDAELILSLPGLGHVLGARVLAEFGDAPNRYKDAKSRRNYAGTSPVTIASGTSKAVIARFKRNRRLIDACWQWSLSALTASPGARATTTRTTPGPTPHAPLDASSRTSSSASSTAASNTATARDRRSVRRCPRAGGRGGPRTGLRPDGRTCWSRSATRRGASRSHEVLRLTGLHQYVEVSGSKVMERTSSSTLIDLHRQVLHGATELRQSRYPDT